MAEEAELGIIEAWLLQSPVDWSQVISTRLALRVLPEVLRESVPDDWFADFSMSFLRASVTNWILRQPLNAEGTVQLAPPGARAAADAAFIVRAAARAADTKERFMPLAADIIANATDAARADEYPEFAARASYDAVRGSTQFPHLSHSVENDRQWLIWHSKDLGTNELWSERLAKLSLWLTEAGYTETNQVSSDSLRTRTSSVPASFETAWTSAKQRLISEHETYRVWTDWYESILEGESRAFGASQAADDFVRNRIIEADQPFWRQNPIIINETILSWIEQLQLEDELDALIDKTRASKKFGLNSSIEKQRRAALLNCLSSIASLEPPAHGAIGHNQPPEPVEWQIEFVIFNDIKILAGEAVEMLAEAAPDPALAAQQISVIGAGLKRLQSLTDRAAEKAADAFGTAMGAAAGIGLVSIITLTWTDLLEAATAWLRSIL